MSKGKIALPCRGCQQQRVKVGLSHSDNTCRLIYLIVMETDGVGEERIPHFYCLSCAINVLDEMKLELFTIQEKIKNELN